VYVKLRPHRQQSVVRRICPKLAPQYYGPFKILDKIGDVAYKLELPLNSRIHPVFHVSQLKKAVGSHVAEPELPKELEVEADQMIEPERVLAHREILRSGQAVKQLLVKWKDYAEEDATWEDELHFYNQFPHRNLGDKVVLLGVGSDRNTIDESGSPKQERPKPNIWKVYTRRNKGVKPKVSY